RSMSAGLDASTVTPGSTAPDESWTTPTMLARSCARPGAGTRDSTAETIATTPRNTRRMSILRRGREAEESVTVAYGLGEILDGAMTSVNCKMLTFQCTTATMFACLEEFLTCEQPSVAC